jgi:hypothetical protein
MKKDQPTSRVRRVRQGCACLVTVIDTELLPVATLPHSPEMDCANLSVETPCHCGLVRSLAPGYSLMYEDIREYPRRHLLSSVPLMLGG